MRYVKGYTIDSETRCQHYATEKDIIAIKFYCCHTYYPCYKCHEACTDHSIKKWPKENFSHQAILCGVCKTEHTIVTYLNNNSCPVCTSTFNAGCQNHYAIYFDMPAE